MAAIKFGIYSTADKQITELNMQYLKTAEENKKMYTSQDKLFVFAYKGRNAKTIYGTKGKLTFKQIDMIKGLITERLTFLILLKG